MKTACEARFIVFDISIYRSFTRGLFAKEGVFINNKVAATMTRWLLLSCVVMWAFIQTVGAGISSKMDFGDDSDTVVSTNSSQTGDDDVEVKHTIVVSTKLKNNNRRGLHASNDGGDAGIKTIGRSQMPKKDDSGEVPVMRGYKAVDSTHIRTPDSRIKNKVYPDAVFINRNVGDELHVYPELANTNQWRPSTIYNNVNWWRPEDRLVTYNVDRKANRSPAYRTPGKFHRKITDDAMTEFYCCKCRDLIRGSRGATGQQRINPLEYETTTKVKIDGKLAKLN